MATYGTYLGYGLSASNAAVDVAAMAKKFAKYAEVFNRFSSKYFLKKPVRFKCAIFLATMWKPLFTDLVLLIYLTTWPVPNSSSLKR